MNYKLFIDDERFPPDDGESWVIARDYDAAISVFKTMGCPNFISFDHDLGPDSKTGFDIAKALVEMALNEEIVIPDDFTFYVHSQNPVGAENIRLHLNRYLKFRKDNVMVK